MNIKVNNFICLLAGVVLFPLYSFAAEPSTVTASLSVKEVNSDIGRIKVTIKGTLDNAATRSCSVRIYACTSDVGGDGTCDQRVAIRLATATVRAGNKTFTKSATVEAVDGSSEEETQLNIQLYATCISKSSNITALTSDGTAKNVTCDRGVSARKFVRLLRNAI